MASMDIEAPSRHEDVEAASPQYIASKEGGCLKRHGISATVFALALVGSIIIIALLAAILSNVGDEGGSESSPDYEFLESPCGKYQWYDEKNAICKPCSTCETGLDIVVECTTLSDTVCGHCRAGYFLDQATGVCEPCPDGCTHCKFEENDGLVCLPCLTGFYYRQGNLGAQGHCTRCSTTCPPGEQIFFPCANDKDLTCGVPGIFANGEFAGQTWEDIVAQARGGTCNFWMWDGAPHINEWVSGWLADNLRAEYGVNLILTPAPDKQTDKIVELVENEKLADITSNGLVDLLWINGHNFHRMATQNLLYGPFASNGLPSSQWYDQSASYIAYDYGNPVDGYEFVYNIAQTVFWYNSASVPTPPATIPEFVQWIKDHPGRFTYSQPSDFTGRVFVMHMFFYYAGYEDFLGEDFNEALYLEKAPAVWAVLNDIEASLYDPGNYPETHDVVRDYFDQGLIDFDLSWDPSAAGKAIDAGTAPNTTKTFIFDSGSISDSNFVAIPFNSPNKAAALVAANFIGSLNATYSRALPENWGSLQAVDLSRVPQEWKDKFDAIPRHPVTLSPEELTEGRLGQLNSLYQTRVWEDWITHVRNN